MVFPLNQPKPPKPEQSPGLLVLPRTRRMFQKKHGGAWKVAYADFVTALMALFIVLWMMNSTERVKASVSGYFRDPRGYTRKLGAGPAAAGEGLAVDRGNVGDVEKQIQAALHRMPEFSRIRDNVKLSMTGEGLRIDLLETEQGLFFVTGSASPTSAGERLLESLAVEIGKMPNSMVIEGHTDARPFRNTGAAGVYGNWELSTDRANAARRLLQSYGLNARQVVEVRGYADQKLLDAEKPESPKNRRISLVVKFGSE
ncbi:MAG: flagellar motor protein MotB [Bryobacteraceae bacterium]|jgi:chemotaxis protein MotB